jgi:hypothetical protein
MFSVCLARSSSCSLIQSEIPFKTSHLRREKTFRCGQSANGSREGFRDFPLRTCHAIFSYIDLLFFFPWDTLLQVLYFVSTTPAHFMVAVLCGDIHPGLECRAMESGCLHSKPTSSVMSGKLLNSSEPWQG